MFAALDSLSDRHCIDETKASTLGKIEHLSIQMALLCEPLVLWWLGRCGFQLLQVLRPCDFRSVAL